MSRIEDYALLGDLQTAALVSTTGSIDWLCLPKFDSPACFAALLDTPDAGHWRIAPAGAEVCTTRRYVEDTLVLETEWRSHSGTVRVIDFMPPRGHAPDVVRIVEGVHGSVAMHRELRLRFDYGRVMPWVRHHGDRMEAIAGPDRVRLRTPVPTQGHELSTVSDFTVRAGDRIPFVLTWNPSHEPPPKAVDAEDALRDTLTFWSEWSASGTPVTGPYREAIKRSLLTLKALTYQPTGGIVAAATTSLPEQIGGPRNWDYRYCWLRDSTYTLQALISAGYLNEAKAWREWLLRAVAGDPADLQIMYALDGTRRLPEAELPWLAGYENSKPVRTGNAASDQLQLDVWGETLDGLALARNSGLAATDDAWDLQLALMEHLEGNWDQPDNGLWEMRGARRHFTHSKVMAWVAADRMATAVRTHRELHGPADRWEALRDTIHADVLAHGYDADRNTFTQSYDAPGLDASLLMIPRVGFLAPDRSPSPGHHRRDPERAHRGRLRQALRHHQLRRRTHRRRRAVPGLLVLARRRPAPGRPAAPKPPSCSNGSCSSATTSGCSAKNGTPTPAANSATPPKRSATSPSSPAPCNCTPAKATTATNPSPGQARQRHLSGPDRLAQTVAVGPTVPVFAVASLARTCIRGACGSCGCGMASRAKSEITPRRKTRQWVEPPN